MCPKPPVSSACELSGHSGAGQDRQSKACESLGADPVLQLQPHSAKRSLSLLPLLLALSQKGAAPPWSVSLLCNPLVGTMRSPALPLHHLWTCRPRASSHSVPACAVLALRPAPPLAGRGIWQKTVPPRVLRYTAVLARGNIV